MYYFNPHKIKKINVIYLITIIAWIVALLCFARKASADSFPYIQYTEPSPVAYIEAQYVPFIPSIPTVKFNAWSCVIFVRQYTGRQDIRGIAGNLKPLDVQPFKGGVVLLDEGKWGHVAVITGIASSSLSIIEANYQPGKITTRTLPLDSPDIVGYR